jgi:hypothetical protein
MQWTSACKSGRWIRPDRSGVAWALERFMSQVSIGGQKSHPLPPQQYSRELSGVEVSTVFTSTIIDGIKMG